MPPELAGRDAVIDAWQAMLNRTRQEGRVGAVDTVLTGLRGVGKSALLTRLADLAQAEGYEVIRLHGSGETSLVESLLQESSDRAEHGAGRWEAAKRSLAQIGGVSLSVAGMALGVDRIPPENRETHYHPERLAAIMAQLAGAVRDDTGAGVVLSIDEFQMTRPEDIRLLGGILNHLNTAHPFAGVVFIAAGLPNLPQRMVGPDPDNPYVTNPERLFVFNQIPIRLTADAATAALIRPAQRRGAGWDSDAVGAVLEASGGYPAHLQIYAASAWAQGSETTLVTLADVHAAREASEALIKQQYLAPRWNRLTGRQRAYLTAIAVCGDDASTREVAAVLGTAITAQSGRRDALLRRGEIFESQYGRVQLSMPAMREYALREYPQSVSEDEHLITPAAMMANLDAWRDVNRGQSLTVQAFPEDVITRRRSNDVQHVAPTRRRDAIDRPADHER